MITTVYFDNLNSVNELGLILAKRKIGTPRVKKRLVEVPGGTPLDYSEFFGEVEYENRQINLSFNAEADKKKGSELYQNLINKIHGKKMKIRFSDEPGFYYYGRVEAGDYDPRRTVFKIDVNVDAEPYRWKSEKTSKSFYIYGTQNITISNLKKKTVPKITVATEMTIQKGNVSVTLKNGTFEYPELQLEEGENAFTVINNNYYGENVIFDYQEGEL